MDAPAKQPEAGLFATDFPNDDITDATASLLGAIERGNDGLKELHEALHASNTIAEIDPLIALPVLLPYPGDAAESLLDDIAEKCSAKELVIAIQEAAERLKGSIVNMSQEEDAYEDDNDNGDELTPSQRTARILRSYAKTVPRLKKGKRSTKDVLSSLVTEVESLIPFLGQNADADDGRELVLAVSLLVCAVEPWIRADSNEKDAANVLYNLTKSTLESCISSINSDVVQKAFQKQFPRFVRPVLDEPASSQIPNDPAADTYASLSQLGFSACDFENDPSMGSLILLAHAPSYTPSLSTLRSFMPIIIASIQTYTALEETLVILLNALGPLRSLSPRLDLSEALVTPLIHVLPPLAGVHPDPSIRHIIFRLLSLILSYTPSPLRFQLLQDLITDPDVTPQMRVAAIGLVKEAVLENLSASKSSLGGEQLETAFTSPNFMQMFSPIIFKLDLPQAAGQEDLDLQEFLESPEPLRLVEGLGLYYVVLQRDVDNRTGIRDPDSMRVIDKELLTVLRQQLTKWNEDLNETPDTAELLANHNALQLGILEMWLDRIQSATAAL